jgi:hypothetical protein
METKKNQLEQVADVLKGMFNEKELAMMEAQYQKMLKEWEEKQNEKETNKED